MRYSPKRKSFEYILEKRHFKKHPSRGYVREIQGTAKQLHAIMKEGDIDLHFDEPHPEAKWKHKSRKYCKTVKHEIEQFKKIDISENWFVRKYDEMINLYNYYFERN
jgi:hypothetical protein